MFGVADFGYFECVNFVNIVVHANDSDGLLEFDGNTSVAIVSDDLAHVRQVCLRVFDINEMRIFNIYHIEL